jgi:formylglycine-generating enzyme required for sulfatase activity/dienelactone hydrolase/predicted Ser/Thr protein kinase
MDRISHYRIDGELGRGGMGVVYRAVDTRLGRPVAIKVLPAEATADPERHQRFVQEARSASALNHPNIVTIYEIGEDGGTTFIAMELVDGTPLDRLLADGPLPVVAALDYAAQAAAALGAAHASGIVHRDIKPANIVITRDGRAKVLDFGLAKLIGRTASEATLTAVFTRPGTVMGTPAYMSPEQAQGEPVGAWSDVFSLGAVLYEMLAGRRPFAGSSDAALVTAILRDPPTPLRTARPETPPEVEAIIARALAKDPTARYPEAGALHTDLTTAHARLTRPAESAWRRPAVFVPVALLLLAAAAFGTWQTITARRARWAQGEAVPEIERLQLTERSLDAVRLARNAEPYAGQDVARIRATWFPFDTTTDPDGAEVSVRNYLDENGAWEVLGATPVRGHALPLGLYRLRITKPGYLPMDVSYSGGRPTIQLVPETSAVPGMMFVPGGPFTIGVAGTVQLPDYWVDKYEVTNREFKRFVDAGGYADPKHWQAPLREGTRVLSLEQARQRFLDTTGQHGLATWELGSYPDGQEDFPVAGISWFEAAAYAQFAGKSLPTLYHWRAASGMDHPFSDILRVSQFDAKGPAKVGDRQGVGPWGTFDMAGNVQEWCINEAGSTGLRYILGGGWNDPAYRFREPEARNPWDRAATFGVRLIKELTSDDAARTALRQPIARVEGDPQSLVPVSDEQFDLLRGFYAYDRHALDARVESVDESAQYWRKEKVSFSAAYGGERIPAYLFLPKNARPPYQTIVYFPSSYAREVPSSQALDHAAFDFIVRSGRAVLYPVYFGTFERRKPEPPGDSAVRDRVVLYAKDFFRAVDYLETRPDIDATRLGYYGLSHGAFVGPIPVALEPRIKAAVFAAGGLRHSALPAIQTANFMPRVKVPVLLVNGRDDFSVPQRDQDRFLELLGTPPEHKRLARLDGGHVPSDMLGFYREVLNWYDTYMGRVK